MRPGWLLAGRPGGPTVRKFATRVQPPIRVLRPPIEENIDQFGDFPDPFFDDGDVTVSKKFPHTVRLIG